MARSKRKSIHYVNNADFSQAVVDYVTIVEQSKEKKKEIPKVPDYVAQCFLRIAEGLSHKSNFCSKVCVALANFYPEIKFLLEKLEFLGEI